MCVVVVRSGGGGVDESWLYLCLSSAQKTAVAIIDQMNVCWGGGWWWWWAREGGSQGMEEWRCGRSWWWWWGFEGGGL